ncbi:PA0069 family radical SAM protein [Rhodopila sp.]|uniref:PA0069 family radical SAM protein n=1 Tax=Rhodopila sp. TaxID=2480087 RepID=UPI003D150A28
MLERADVVIDHDAIKYDAIDQDAADHAAIVALENVGLPDPEADQRLPGRRAAGRGAVSNPQVRFDMHASSAFDDGWDTLTQDVGDLPRLDTSLMRDATRSAISWNTSPDIGFDRAVNPYRGCEHGCIYCYARPTHAYLGYSPGLDFETKLIFKPQVAELLEKELRRPGYVARTLALGSNTDPYQPVERTLKLTRSVLEVLDRFNHPVGIVTKSTGVLRDLDILSSMASRNLVRVYLSVTTLDPRLARVMEPRAATPARRLQAIAELARAGVPTGVLVAPMIPALNDSEMEKIVEASARAGATHAGYVLLRLPLELRQMFEAWLQTHFPDRARHVLSLIRETRSGSLNDPRFHHRFSGQGVHADLLMRRYARISRQLGLGDHDAQLACDRFAVPGDAAAATSGQMSLF